MDNKYIELFGLVARTVSNLAEQVMEEHHKNNDEAEEKNAETMRNDFLNLYYKLNDPNAVLDKPDYARLLIGTIIVTNQLDARIKREEDALRGYKVDIIPKLDRINNAESDSVAELAEELFSIKEEKTTEKSE